MGSGAAVSAAIVRALAEAGTRDQGSGIRRQESEVRESPASNFQLPASSFQPVDISALVYEVERLHHGTPSGIDNTVVVYGQPVHFVRGQPPQTFTIGRPFTLAIADTGIHSPTKVAVGDVRRAWEREPRRFESLFDRVAMVVEAARSAIAAGEPEQLGPLMDENHALLQEIGVSSPELDALVAAARSAGRARRQAFRRGSRGQHDCAGDDGQRVAGGEGIGRGGRGAGDRD